MREPYYSIICNLIRVSSVCLMGITWLSIYYLAPYHKKIRFFVAFVSGYFFGVFSVWCYWYFAAKFAPTEKIAAEILSKDGSPMIIAPLVIPIYLVGYFIIVWPVVFTITKLYPNGKIK